MPRRRLLVIAPFCAEVALRGYEKFLRFHLPDLILHYDVDLVTLGSFGRRALHRSPGVASQTVVPSSLMSRVVGGLLCLLRGLPTQCAEFCAPAFRRAIAKMVGSHDYDRVLCYMARTFVSVPSALHSKTIVFAIDPLLASYRLSARVSGFPLHVAYALEGFLVGRLESRIMTVARRYVLISSYDARRYVRLFRPPHGIDLIRYGSTPAKSIRPLPERDRGMLLVSGSGFYAPNVRALRYLLEAVWPEVRKRAGYRLRIIGADIDPHVRQLASTFPDVEVLGFVENVYDHLSSAFACLCLVDLNVGVQTKLLEAMSCGTPAICSRASRNGVGAKNGRDVLVATTPAEIVDALEALRESPELWKAISENAYGFICRRYLWEYSSQDLLTVLDR
jgi:glycosyltransferase involved in cell wall biosynthesis